MHRPRLLLLLCLVAGALCAQAQSYPYPGKGTPVPCTGCGGTSEGLPTYPYDDPLVAHAGRFVDSTTTGNAQNLGMRTIRARWTRVARPRNRIYVALGETIGAYALDQFFTTTLRQAMVPVNKIPVKTSTVWSRYGDPFEKLARPESIFYAEALDSGWQTYLLDAQRVLTDFDVDERGYVYIATVNFGWGIALDTGASDAQHMQFVYQDPALSITPAAVIALTAGTSHSVVLSSTTRGSGTALLFDVAKPAKPVQLAMRTGSQHGIVSWDKFDAGERLALLNGDGHLRVYDYAAYVAGGAPLADLAPPAGKKFGQAAFDEDGALWIAVTTTSSVTSNVLMKLTPTAGGYTRQSFDVYGSPFSPTAISAEAGRIAVIGLGSASRELRLFEVIDGAPHAIDTGDFFRNYYEVVPAGYADPGYLTGGAYVRLVEAGGQTYLIYSAEGLGDVYRLQRGAANPIPTSIALTSTLTGNIATLTAIVTPQSVGATPPGGVVTFTRDGVAYASAPLEPYEGGWRATVPIDLAAVATASYEGDDLYGPSGPAHVTEPGHLPAPSAVSATATGAHGVSVTWQPVSGAIGYGVYRSTSISAPFTFVAHVSTPPFVDTTVAPNTSYLYRVAAFDGADGAPGAFDVATTVAFTDAALSAGTPIKLAHLTELRTAVNALRAAAALRPFAFTDATPTIIKAVHILELRIACDEARRILALGAVGLAPITPQVTFIRKDDIVHLRQGVD